MNIIYIRGQYIQYKTYRYSTVFTYCSVYIIHTFLHYGSLCFGWWCFHRQPGEDDAGTDDLPGRAPRVPAVEKQPEYARLRELGLAVRPAGCFLGIHPGSQVWRSASSTSIHFSRSFGKARTSWQALLRVMELMLDSYVSENLGKHDVKLVKHQLSRIRKLRLEEPPHQD